DIEEPGGRRSPIRAATRRVYSLRYDRFAAGIYLVNSFIWALLLVRNWIFPPSPEYLLPIEKTLRAIDANLPGGLIPVALFTFAVVDCVLAWLLLRGIKYGRLLAVGHAAFAIAMCLIYFIAFKDFGPAFILGMLQGVILIALSTKAGLILIYPSGILLV